MLHLCRSFWHKVLYDIGAVSTKERSGGLVARASARWYTAFVDAEGGYVSAKEKTDGLDAVKLDAQDVVKKGDGFALAADESIRRTRCQVARQRN